MQIKLDLVRNIFSSILLFARNGKKSRKLFICGWSKLSGKESTSFSASRKMLEAVEGILDVKLKITKAIAEKLIKFFFEIYVKQIFIKKIFYYGVFV